MTREEAIEIYNGLINTKIKEAFEFFAPELRESEDAMMEKAIVDALLSHCNSINLLSERGYQIEDVKAWLEKQKERKPNYCHYGGDPNIERCKCCSATCSGRLADEQKLAECSEVELTFRGEKVKVKRQFFRDDKGRKYSTTEQDEDAAWYALRAWCEKKGVSLYDLYPREEWSEEDEDFINMLILHFNYLIDKGGDSVETYKSYIEKLKSLRPQPKQEWSKIDEQISNGLIKALENLSSDWLKLHGVIKSDIIAWLKCHHNHPSWKPSKEQILAIVEALKYLPNNKDEWIILNTLIDVLRKLM